MEITVELLEKILDFVPSCIFFKDTECRYVFATHFWTNPIAVEYTEIIGKTDIEVFGDIPSSHEAYNITKKVIETGKGVSFVNDYSIPNKEAYMEIKIEAVLDDDKKVIGAIGFVNDITERIILERKLETSARTDILTGLYNRFYLDFWKNNILKPSLLPLFIISADCDGLKYINDTFGHHVGDEYLHLTTSVFRIGLPEAAIKFRTGGDEFLIIIPNTEEKEGLRHIEHMKSFSKHVTLEKRPIQISFGHSIMKGIEEDFYEKLKEADILMYKEKKLHHEQLDNQTDSTQ